MLLIKDIRLLEYNPHVQYKVNRGMLIFFALNMPVCIILQFFFPKLWLQISVTYLVQISIFALIEGFFGNMSAALAAFHASKPAEAPKDPATNQLADTIDVPDFDAVS